MICGVQVSKEIHWSVTVTVKLPPNQGKFSPPWDTSGASLNDP